MDVQQFFKRDHARMSGLFDKLAETSDNALKTRERLFDDLKIEIQAHKAVVEDRLYPLLRKHKETRDLKPTARELNQIDRQLSQLEAVPKDDPQFLAKLRELKKTMESQLREEERHIVPALKRALESNEFKELARELADGKREEQQEARQRSERNGESQNGQRASSDDDKAGGMQERGGVGESGANAETVVRQLSEAGRQGARTILDEQQRLSKAVQETAQQSAEIAPQLASQPLQTAAKVSQEVASTAQEVQQALAESVFEGFRVAADAYRDAFRCGNLAELSGLQARLFAQWAQLNLDTSSRVLRAAQRPMASAFSRDEDTSARRS